MANAINGNGSVYFGWSESVGVDQATTTGRDLFTQLISNKYTSGEAYQKVVANGNGSWRTARFSFLGDGDLSLVERETCPPTNLRVSSPSCETIEISFVGGPEAEYYEIKIEGPQNTIYNFGIAQEDPPFLVSFLLGGLASGQYQVSVRANYGVLGYSDFTEPIKVNVARCQ